MMRKGPVRVGLLSPQSIRNLGDTATFAAAIAAYRRRLPNAEIVSIVPEPAQSASLLGTAGFPLYGDGPFTPAPAAGTTQFPPKHIAIPGRLAATSNIYCFVGTLDAIVFTGGGLLDDFWGGPWALPFWVCVWATAARMRGVRVLFHAIGYDRVTTRASRALFMSALRMAHYRSFRDAESLHLLRAMGLSGPCDVLPDLAFALDWPVADTGTPTVEANPYVIVNPVSQRLWTHSRDDSYADYLQAFAALSRALIQRGLSIKLLSTQGDMDSDALAFVADELRTAGKTNWERPHVTRVEHFMALARKARLVVSSRLHGLILALVAGTPVVSVSPMRKVSRLMADTGLAHLNLDRVTMNADNLVATVNRALHDEQTLRRQIATTVSRYRRQLNENFDRMITDGLLGDRARLQFVHCRQPHMRSPS